LIATEGISPARANLKLPEYLDPLFPGLPENVERPELEKVFLFLYIGKKEILCFQKR